MKITEIIDGKTKSIYANAILNKLPEWFGNKQALEDFVVGVASLPFWAATDDNGYCVGFISAKTHYGHTGDIYVCGVLPERHRHGIGKALYFAAEKHLIKNSCKYIMVKTLSDTVSYEPYARTRAFYKGVGFMPLVTLTEMWDEENPCLIMIKSLTGG